MYNNEPSNSELTYILVVAIIVIIVGSILRHYYAGGC